MNRPPEPRQAPRRRRTAPVQAPAAPPALEPPALEPPAPEPPAPGVASPGNTPPEFTPEQADAAALALELEARAAADPRFRPLAEGWARGEPALPTAPSPRAGRWRGLLPGLLALAGAVFLVEGRSAGIGVMLLIGAGVLLLTQRQPRAQRRREASAALADWIFAALGLERHATPRGLAVPEFRDLGLLPESSEEAASDELSGAIEGVTLRLCQLQLWHTQARRGTVSAFDGMLVMLDSPVTVERPLWLATKGAPRRLLEQVLPLGLPPSEHRGDFESTFDVSGLEPGDSVPAALHPGLLRLAATAQGPLRVALFDRWIYLSVDAPHRRPGAALGDLLGGEVDRAAVLRDCLAHYDSLVALVRAFWPARPDDGRAA